jgi:hypothetical protein
VSQYPYCGSFQPPPESGLAPSHNDWADGVTVNPWVSSLYRLFAVLYSLGSTLFSFALPYPHIHCIPSTCPTPFFFLEPRTNTPFNNSPVNNQTVFECKYEIDSLCGFLKLSRAYYGATKDASFMNANCMSSLYPPFTPPV